MTKIGYVAGALTIVSLAISGCASEAGPTNDPAPGASGTTASAPAPRVPAPAVATPDNGGAAASGAADRGQLLGTILASAQTTQSTSVAVWATYKHNGKLTTVGYDKDGLVKTELSVQRISGSRDIELAAPSSGALRLKQDGTILSNTLLADRTALSAMHLDFDAGSKDAAYSWVKWALTFVSCALAGAEAGVNLIADAACVAGAADLLMD